MGPRRSVDLKNKKYEENYMKAQHNKLLKTCDKEKIKKVATENMLYKRIKDNNDSRFFTEKNTKG